MNKKQLFDNDSDSDEPGSGFTINKEYAKSYNKLRSRELLKKLKDKGQLNSSDDSSSDSDSTDNETIDPKFDEAFFQALATLKKKDSSTYDANVRFFEEFDEGKLDIEKKSSKVLTVKDYERKILLEKGGIYEDEDSENEENKRAASPSYNQEQINIKNAFKKVIEEDDDDEGEDEWGGIFRKRQKTKQEEANEEEQYTKWLAGEETNIGAKAEELKPLKEYWNNPKLSKDDKFLRDYILSNGYNKSNDNDVPTYDEIVGDDELEISEDEAELERQAEFEHKFNFRFEEPDSEFIKRYPRTIEHSVRKVDNRRKEKRTEVKERKLREKKEKMKELEMINAIRKKEIEEKLRQLQKVTGDETIQFAVDDIEGDFDSREYDLMMKKVYNDDFYRVDEGDKKPDCPDIEDLKVEDWDNYDPANDEDEVGDAHCEDDDFVMDCDYDPEQQRKSLQDELIENTRDKRKRRKRQSKFAQMLKKEKPAFNPVGGETYGKYIDENYDLNYEDIVGGIPCRYKYSETVPNDFGLTVEEILLAKNKELNCWASLKKATQIRPEHVELNEVKIFKNKAANEYLKRKILPSLYGEGSEDDEEAEMKVANKKDGQSKKSKKPETNSGKQVTEEFNKEISENETTEAKIKKTEKTKKPENESKIKFVIEDEIEGRGKETVSTTGKAKVKQAPEKKTKNISNTETLPTKKSSPKKNASEPAARTTQKKSLDSKQKTEVKKANIKAILFNKGGITRKKIKPQKNKIPSATFTKKPSISDERLRAFGLNPKKFHKKLKYGNKPTVSGAGATTSSKNVKTQNKKVDKLNQKKIKKKLLKVLGS